MNDIEVFIKKFQNQETNEIFVGDCSYWFAAILYRRFIRDGAKVMFDTTENHFGTKVCGKVYDITGDVTAKYNWVSWLELQNFPNKEYIISKYIMF